VTADRRSRFFLFFLSLSLLLIYIVGPSSADGNNGLIPFSQLASVDRQVVEEILFAPTLSRELKGVKFRSRKEVYEYFLNHPDFAAAVAGAFGLSDYHIVKEANFSQASGGPYWGTDGRGATGHFRVVYADKKKRVFILDGTIDKKWLPSVSAKAVVVLSFEHKADADGSYVENDIYGYIKMDNPFVAQLAKLFHPIIGAMASEKIRHVLSVGATISEEAYRDPAGFLKKLEANPALSQEELDRFRRDYLLSSVE
jgi:hypothetical protein